MGKERVLYFDFETTLGVYWGYELGKQYVGWQRIKKEPEVCVICYAINEGKVQTLTFDLKKYKLEQYDDEADKKMLEKFVSIANKCHLLVAHNGKFFDVAFLMNRVMKHKLPTLAPILIDDTYLQMKDKKTQSHGLDYLLRYYGIGKKKETRGLPMWIDVGQGKKSALKEMADYCIDDVVGLRDLYKYCKPYNKSALNLAVVNGDPNMCPNCGATGTLRVHDTKRYTAVGYKTQYKCTSCGCYKTYGSNELKNTKFYPR